AGVRADGKRPNDSRRSERKRPVAGVCQRQSLRGARAAGDDRTEVEAERRESSNRNVDAVAGKIGGKRRSSRRIGRDGQRAGAGAGSGGREKNGIRTVLSSRKLRGWDGTSVGLGKVAGQGRAGDVRARGCARIRKVQ